MDKYGISLTNADGSMKTFREVIDNLRSSLGGLSESEQVAAATAIFGKESFAGMLAIVNASDADFKKLSDSVNNAAGAAERMAQIKLDNFEGTIVNRLHDLTLDIFQHIQEANELDLADPQEYRERRYEQKKALTECKTVLFLIELSFEKELISSEQCAEWTRHVMNVKNMTAKWRKQDRERFAALQQNRGITPRR